MLVSIVVVTYNFEKIIEECLKSIENQTYKNLEIIISDDCSKDKTLEICKKWYELNKKKYNIQILSSLQNDGVTKNINKGVRVAKGEWVKILAGDDILKEDAIKNFMNFKNIEKAEVIFSKAETFMVKNGVKIKGEILPSKEDEKFYYMSYKEKWNLLLEDNKIVAPAAIIRRTLLEKMNFFDERFKMVEDWPFWIKLLKNDVKFHYYPVITVYYRKSNASVSGKKENEKVNKIIHNFKKEYYEYIYKKEVKSKIMKLCKRVEIIREEIIIKNNNRSNLLSQILKIFKLIKKLRVNVKGEE